MNDTLLVGCAMAYGLKIGVPVVLVGFAVAVLRGLTRTRDWEENRDREQRQ